MFADMRNVEIQNSWICNTIFVGANLTDTFFGNIPVVLKGHEGDVTSVAYSNDGKK